MAASHDTIKAQPIYPEKDEYEKFEKNDKNRAYHSDRQHADTPNSIDNHRAGPVKEGCPGGIDAV
jgi:hypothetical protein